MINRIRRIPATGADEWGEHDRSGRGTRRRLEPLDELVEEREPRGYDEWLHPHPDLYGERYGCVQ